jgi:hypothetical protein
MTPMTRKLQSADAQRCAERVLAAEQFVLELGAEDDEGAGAVASSAAGTGRRAPCA